jgi:hypothetical protein
MYIANYPVDNPSDYWKISPCLVFLYPLVEEISKGVVINEERGFFYGVGGRRASYNNPASYRIIRYVHLYYMYMYIHCRFNHGTYLHAYSSRKVEH